MKKVSITSLFLGMALFVSTAFAMKHPREEEIIEPAKKQKIEEEEKKLTEFQEQRFKELEESASALEQFPGEIQQFIFEYLLTGTGPTNIARLYNATQNIRNFLKTNKQRAQLLYDVAFNVDLLKKLSARYTNYNMLEAALALATPGAAKALKHILSGLSSIPLQKLIKEMQKALFNAMRTDESQFNFLLASIPEQNKAVYLDAVDAHRSTLLNYAAGHKMANVVTKLITAGADVNKVNATGATSLILAAEIGVDKIVEILLAAHADVNIVTKSGRTALIQASQNGHEKIVEKLLAIPGIEINHQENQGMTALHSTSKNGHEKIVEKLLAFPEIEINAVNKSGQTPLHFASQNGHEKIVEKLIAASKGAGVNAVEGEGNTPLILAVVSNHEKVIDLLLFAAADVNIANKAGQTPLFIAARYGHENIVKRLLEISYIKVNQATNTQLLTPLMAAAHYGHVGIVKLLLQAKADVTKKNQWHKTALMYAQESASPNKEEIIKLLKEYGAKE